MTPDEFDGSGRHTTPGLGRTALLVGGFALFGAGALVGVLFFGRDPAAPVQTPPMVGTSDSPAAVSRPPADQSGPLPDVTVRVPQDVAARAGIELATAGSSVVTSRLRLPGKVQPNEYQRVVVVPLTGGRVTAVPVQLGDVVQRGAPLARIFSSEFGDAQARYAAMRAELQAAEQRAARTARLVEIGAASRQELEADQAQRARLAAEVEGAGARLRELGLSPQRVDATRSPSAEAAILTVPAPIAGVITARTANVGLVVQPSSELFTVTALSPVWVVADVQESDLSKVHVGVAATVEAGALAGKTIAGRVSYISPDVRPDTRTAQVRIEMPNVSGALRFGMFVTVELLTPGASAVVTVPAAAVQTIGARHFVYLAPAGRSGEYLEREVVIGTQDGQTVEILHGVRAGEQIVAKGSFLIRAERERR